MNSNNLLKKILVVGVIVLFVGVAIQPSLGTTTPKKAEVEPKAFLFQTIIDIANNPEVKGLFEQVEDYNELIDCDYNFRNVYFKLLIMKPRFFISSFINKPTITHEYLNSAYNQGCEIVRIIGEKDSIEILESIEITNPRFFNDMKEIIKNNDELNNKIKELAAMNGELKTDPPFMGSSLICSILEILLIPLFLLIMFLGGFADMFLEKFPELYKIFYVIVVGGFLYLIVGPIWVLYLELCM